MDDPKKEEVLEKVGGLASQVPEAVSFWRKAVCATSATLVAIPVSSVSGGVGVAAGIVAYDVCMHSVDSAPRKKM